MDEDAISALGALYQGEKADASGIFTVTMALMGIAAAYLVGAIGSADKYGGSSLPWTVVLLIPVPLWLIAAFHSLLVLNAMMHGISIRTLEDKLFKMARLNSNLRDGVGSHAGDRIMDLQKAHISHQTATVFVYGGVGLGVAGFTLFILVRGWSHLELWADLIAAALYLAAACIVVWSWLYGLRLVNDTEKQRLGIRKLEAGIG